MTARWRLARRLLLITFIGCVLTLVSTRFILLTEEQTIRQRLNDDSRQIEHQLRQMMLNYAFATEWSARSLASDSLDYKQRIDEEIDALLLYYPSLQRLLVLDDNFGKAYERFRPSASALSADDFTNSAIAELLQQAPTLPHAQSAPAEAFSSQSADTVIAVPFNNQGQQYYLVLVVNIQ